MFTPVHMDKQNKLCPKVKTANKSYTAQIQTHSTHHFQLHQREI